MTETVANMGKADMVEQRTNVSPEQYDKLEADLILGTSSGARAQLDELGTHPTFSKVPAVARGSYLAFERWFTALTCPFRSAGDAGPTSMRGPTSHDDLRGAILGDAHR